MRARSVLMPFAAAVLVTACGQAERSSSGEIEAAGPVDAFSMQVGDCFDDAYLGSEEISEVPGIPCSEPHDNEVYALFDITTEDFPGQEQVDRLAEEGCYERFEPAIGASYEESVLMFTTMTPTEASWRQLSDREVICVAFHMEWDKLTGSVLGSGL